MTTTVHTAKIVAHRGFSSRQPEMTLAAYTDAISWAAETGQPLGLECDVRFSRDDQLVCLHDSTLTRTSNGRGFVDAKTLAELRDLDFGSWKLPNPTAAQRSVMSLPDLLDLVQNAQHQGIDISLSIETKHPNSHGLQLERHVSQLLGERGWDRAGSPVRLITFSVPGARLLAHLVPEVDRTLLIDRSLDHWGNGLLPSGIRDVGVNIRLLRKDPGFVRRARAHGNEVHAWTVNEVSDLQLCRDLGIASVTTDYPDRAWEVLRRTDTGLSLGSTRKRWFSRSTAA
ncbi:MAG: glycerophosphodiester phosphodiesterase family protein [Propionibacteriaceae bacterium]